MRNRGKASEKKAAAKAIAVEHLPIVKPADYEEWLQSYFNAHPCIGDMKLVQALEKRL